ncbi:uncharacterized protein C8Q71DRAFT_783783 [Rhodofomes roseus]|uniref:NADH dehydrogenase [ubiquinone] 1 beta subcomplex subunit 4 n=1 Tax=Rhodofomes roseus TaxID=34475 RepID=A0A4Y9Y4K5_9APHY|nr:uncharacterized protein C8Q71DRAFT_783783 [Rhodofomes roseus]KAH9830927.1 hypothetical protein C8Q71DRAFT_783783 [Rhodofomes roseus]TFY57120.1 hypothetical protein EVJ58_g7219 [Rhodofomes roseus]
MAGHGYTKLDPAIERWNQMRETVYQRFRFTPRSTMQVLVGLVFFPGAIYWLSTNQDQKWSWSGKLKDQSLARVAPSTEAE